MKKYTSLAVIALWMEPCSSTAIQQKQSDDGAAVAPEKLPMIDHKKDIKEAYLGRFKAGHFEEEAKKMRK